MASAGPAVKIGTLGEPVFAQGETVLCYHGEAIYAAKCIGFRRSPATGVFEYRSHYNGWNKNWDEWVVEGRMIKRNAENLQLQKDINSELTARAKKEKEEKAKAQQAKDERERAKRRKVEANAAVKERQKTATVKEQLSEPIEIEIPQILKDQIVDDWNFVSNEKRLVPLPRTGVTVRLILAEFSEQCRKRSALAGDVAAVVTNGVECIFNAALGTALLYTFERYQYAQILQEEGENTPLSEIYGAEHLLRLLTKLGEQFTYEASIGKDADEVACVHALLDHLQLNFSAYFVAEYEMPSPEYSRAQSTHVS